MKILFSTAAVMMLTVMFVTSGIAQKELSKDELLKELATLSNSSSTDDKEKAYQTGKEFLTRFGSEKNDNVKKVRKYVENYRTSTFFKAVDGNKFPTAFTLGKEILADEPQNVDILINLTYAGYNAMAAGDKSFVDDTISSAKKAEELLEAGTSPKSFAPFKDKPEALAWTYYIEGTLVTPRDKKAGAVSIYKATLLESPIKENPLPYNMIALYYEDEYTNLGNAMKAKLGSKPVNEAEVAALEERVKKALDLMLDAYARSSKKADAENAANKDALKSRLAQVYKFVKKTDEGLSEYVSYITKTPLPDPSKF
ncbi:MAG: hypothetical protein IPK01_01965 [Acidobacteria bacterium]|nr:hypothetical protein [Acidobacteriota bacterium]